MTDPDPIRLFVEPLEGLALRYMITGGVASVIHEYYKMSGSDRHLRDVAHMLHISADKLDSHELDSW